VWRNKCKRADDIQQKRLCPNSIDVIAAGDADPTVAEELAVRIMNSTNSIIATVKAAECPNDVEDDVQDDKVCSSCKEVVPTSKWGSHHNRGMLKMRDRKMQDWKMRDQYAELENAGIENREND